MGYNNFMIETFDTDNFTLVLSGGGALGMAHLGVIHDMEENNIVASELVGTSMGGIIAACMAIGLKEVEIYEHIMDFASVSKWISFSFSGNAIVDNGKIEEIFESIFHDRKIKDTDIPLKLIATNLRNGNKRVFEAKDNVYIKDALLATMAIPGIFDEHVIGNESYVDGFLCENLGINEASFDDVLAVDVLGEHSFDQALPDNFFKTANVLEMFDKSMRLLIYNQSRTHIKNSTKNITLLVPVTKDYKTYSFHKVKEIRKLGFKLLAKYIK